MAGIGYRKMSNRTLLSSLLNMLAPDIRSSLGELQGTLQLVAHDLAARRADDSMSQRRMELVDNASDRVSELTNMLSIVTKLDALSQVAVPIFCSRLTTVVCILSHSLKRNSSTFSLGISLYGMRQKCRHTF